MNLKFIYIPLIGIAITACEPPEKKPVASSHEAYDADNTGRNVRDRDENARTSFNQSESDDDRQITQQIRQEVIWENNLSNNAKNIKIITIDGEVTLRGPVNSEQEMRAIEKIARGVEGVNSVNNQLEIVKNY